MVINGERIYIDDCKNGDVDYEEEELINIGHHYFTRFVIQTKI